MARQSKAKKAQEDVAAAVSWWVYVCPSITGVHRKCVEVCVRVMGGGIADSLDKIHGVDPQKALGTAASFYVICHSSNYSSYLSIRDNYYVPIVTPAWIFRSVLQNSQVLLPTDKFSANPKKVFSSVVLYCVHVESDPRKVIASLVSNGGGQLVSQPTTAATHVLCLRNTGPDYERALEWQSQTKPMLEQVASNLADIREGCDCFLKDQSCGKGASLPDMVVQYLLGQCGLLSPQVVSYDWVQECVKQGRRVSEQGFYFPEKPSTKTPEHSLTVQDLVETCQKQSIYPAAQTDELWKDEAQLSGDSLAGEIFVLARHIPNHFQQRMAQALEALGASALMISKGDAMIQVPKATYVVCGYQSGEEFALATKLAKPIVSMQWIAACIAAKTIVPTAASSHTSLVRQILYAPAVRHGGIDGMEGCVVTLSGFSARSSPTRDEIQALVRLTGACYLAVLSRSHTTHLLCLEPSGEKYKRAQAWGMTNVVQFEWLVECARAWKMIPSSSFSWLTGNAKPVEKEKSSSNTSTLLSVTKSTLAVPKFQVEDALDALDEKENTPLKATNTPTTGKKETVKVDSTTDVTTPIQLRKAIENNALEVIKKKTKPKASKKRPNPTNDDEEVVVVAQMPPVKARRTSQSGGNRRQSLSTTKKPIFLLTGTHEEMAINESIVMALGGTVVQSKRNFDQSCTHVVCKELRRTEKVVAGIASGKWIVTPAYLKESLVKGTFVDEAPFEWGQATAKKRMSCDPRICLPAIKFWRLEIAAGRPGPLDGRQFGVYGTTVPPPEMCKRIIEAGGGQFVEPSSYNEDTIMLVADDVKKTDKKLTTWLAKKIPCVAPGFLIDYVTKDHQKRPVWMAYAI
ncbi:unnamed protein product [Aphanomyces euteiches]|uniref:BRCT domain-containing protein n=1 Tax=Aphanomyces euteiches TaxID=100861 RepID=A0A6G0X378_9STRA|nr:hypothetical protein Ae201684_008946 [Aphanomyces euteiches]KAH9054440.1 hypothetical protein Ae201684P_018160 [Aphanomyces euteiches]KAH9154979.1 hypothetical protein AeRB84_003018 [Aphanomyces euteiches]